MTASGSSTARRNDAAISDVDPAGDDMPQRSGTHGLHIAVVGRCATAGVAFCSHVRSQPGAADHLRWPQLTREARKTAIDCELTFVCRL